MSSFVQALKRTGTQTLRSHHPTQSTFTPLRLTTIQHAHLSTTHPLLAKYQHPSIDDSDPTDRHAINTERHEYSQSGSDNAAAKQRSAWDCKNLTPEEARAASATESSGDGTGKASPLEVSPANTDVSRFTDESGRGASVVHGPSKRVSPKKGKKVDLGPEAEEAGSGSDMTKM